MFFAVAQQLVVAAFALPVAGLFLADAYAGILAIPQAVEAPMSLVPEQAAVLLRADGFISFCTKLIMAFGLFFFIPRILVTLNFTGLLLGLAMLKGWRIAVVVSFVFAAIVNPVPNPIPMIIQALGIVALYFLAVGISVLHDRHSRRTTTGEDCEESPGLRRARSQRRLTAAHPRRGIGPRRAS